MSGSKKVVIKVDVHDEKDKRKAMKAVSSLSGIESMAIDMKDKKMTLIGDVDPVNVVGKLKKWHTEIVTVGPAKEEKKKDEKKDDSKKTDEEKKKDEEKRLAELEIVRKWLAMNPYMTPQYYVHSIEDNPNSGCVIC